MKKEEQFYERIVLLLLMIGAGFLYLNAMQSKSVATGTDMASMDFPKGILIILGILCGVKLAGNLIDTTKNKEKKETMQIDRRIWMSAAAIILYAVFWNILGFMASSLVFFFAETLILNPNVKRKQAVLVAVGIPVVVFLIFGVAFGVDFPEPILELVLG